jgi:hypothetical protein
MQAEFFEKFGLRKKKFGGVKLSKSSARVSRTFFSGA